jgi:hypothetical protein
MVAIKKEFQKVPYTYECEMSLHYVNTKYLKHVKRASEACKELVFKLPAEDVIPIMCGYNDSQLVVEGEYFYVNENSNYVDKTTHRDVTDDQRNGLISLICTIWGCNVESDNVRSPFHYVIIQYAKGTYRTTAEFVERKLLRNGYSVNNWRIEI